MMLPKKTGGVWVRGQKIGSKNVQEFSWTFKG